MKKLFVNYHLKILLFVIASIVTLDQISKNWIKHKLLLHELQTINIVTNIIHIRNYGAAFNMLANNSGKINYFLCIISSILILIMFRIMYFHLKKRILSNIPYTLIIGGAIGNLIDRIYFGYVIDFIDLHIQRWHFATFNIADISIFLGSILLLLNHTD